MSKHLSDEELNHDVLIDASSKSINYINNNRQIIAGAIIGIIVLIAAALGLNYFNNQNEIKAQALLAKAELLFEADSFEAALNGDDINFVMGFEEINAEYGSTKAGNLAAYYAAVCAFELADYEKASIFINKFDVPDGILGVSPLNLKASVLEQNGNLDDAASTYVKAADWVMNDATTPFNLLEAAEAYIAAENNDMAIKVLNRIVKDFEQSAQAVTAKQLIGSLN
jgi:tetratricopeptide (TPR) repeat protein